MPLINDLFATARFREEERASGGKTVVKQIHWTADAVAGGFRIDAVAFNADIEAVQHKRWTVEKIGDAFTRIAEWQREIQLTQSIHSITIKRIVP